jgi:sugar diacid utilization regulator
VVNDDPSGFAGDPRLIELARTGTPPAGMACTELHKLTLLSMLMTDRSEEDILELATATVPTLVPCTAVDFEAVVDEATEPARLADGYAIPVRSLGLALGRLLVRTEQVLDANALFPVQVLGQQLAVALDNARRHAREQQMIGQLNRVLRMHETLTAVAARGGIAEIADAVAELTGHVVVLEHGDGTVHVAGGSWDERWTRGPAARARLVARLRREPRSVRDGGWQVALVGHRSDAVTLLQLADPGHTAGEYGTLVLEYAAAMAAVELARSASLAEAERRLRTDLISELLLGMPEALARTRAAVLGVDLACPRRVALIRPVPATVPSDGEAEQAVLDRLLAGVERAVGRPAGAQLSIVESGQVICLAPAEQDWAETVKRLRADAGAGACRVVVGSICRAVADYPNSLRHARQAAALTDHTDRDLVAFDSLGIHRLLALSNDAGDLDDYIAEWLGELIDYRRRSSTAADLIGTLRSYFHSGASITATAAALHLHESTVKYRLQRIVDLTGHDLSDPPTRFAMQVAIHALEARDALGPS